LPLGGPGSLWGSRCPRLEPWAPPDVGAPQFGPELVLVSAGFDAGRGDPLGGCLVSPQTFGLMTHLLGGLAGGRLVLLLEGGYNLAVTAEGVGQCLGVLLGDPPSLPPPGSPQPAALRALGRSLRAQRGCWSCLRLPRGETPPQNNPGPQNTAPNTPRHCPAGRPLPKITPNTAPNTPKPCSARHGVSAPGRRHSPPGGAADRGRPGGGAKAGLGAESPPGPAPSAEAAAPPCWEEEEELEEGALFAVSPLQGCPHLGAVAPPPAGGALGTLLPPPCGVCGSRKENWLCLSCHQVLCGRYVGGHMLTHGGAQGHPLVLSLRDLGAWCYPCGGYVTHPVLLPTKTFIYRLKFGTDPPSPSL
ncbi:histone deacetylase 6-like, partial [Passerculus sandwichensis]